MKRNISGMVFCLWVLAAIYPVFSYQWPVEQKTIIATFGQNFSGGFYRGIGIAGKGADVRPIDKGELVFYHIDNTDSGNLPSALGSYAVVEHEKKIRSLYGHLDLGNEMVSGGKTSFGPDDSLGTIGESGFTEGARLFLMVLDTEFQQAVNPYLVLPRVEERNRPAIRSVMLTSKNSVINLPVSGTITGGPWEVSAEVFDASSFVNYFCPTAPYRIAVYLNGQETFQFAYDALKEKDGIPRIYPSPDLSHAALYAGDLRMKLGSINPNKGMANLEIIVRDFAGNERTQSFQFRVN